MNLTTFIDELEWNISLKLKEEKAEKLRSTFRQGRLTATASHEYVRAFGTQTFTIALKANHIGSFVGESSPQYALRAVWVREQTVQDPEKALRWLIGCGFNCVIGESFSKELLESYGLINLDLLTLEPKPPQTYQTQKESFLEQIFEIDKRPTLFYINANLFSKNSEEWLYSILDDMGQNSWLAVDSAHLFWEKLREVPDSSANPLAIVQTPEERIRNPFNNSSIQKVEGVIIAVEALPQENSLEARDLWVAGQSLWWSLSPQALTKTWEKINSSYKI